MRVAKPCKIEGCGKLDPKGSHGMCGKHAQRVRRYGDPYYITSEEIRLERLRLAQPTLGRVQKRTYKKLYGRHEHRRVAEQMLGRPLADNEIVHHKDGNKHNNSPDNLEVMTQSEHMKEHWPAMSAIHLATSRIVEWKDERHTTSEWERLLGIPPNVLHSRLSRGWTVERAMLQPVWRKP